MKGFTLLEILVVLVIVGVILGLSSYWYSKLTQSGILVEETAFYLINFLNLAKQKAMIGEENDNWGIWLENRTQNPDYAYLFKGTTSTIKETYSLPQEVGFLEPSENSSKIIIFKKLSGETTSTYLSIGTPNGQFQKYIVVPTSAAIYATSTWP